VYQNAVVDDVTVMTPVKWWCYVDVLT